MDMYVEALTETPINQYGGSRLLCLTNRDDRLFVFIFFAFTKYFPYFFPIRVYCLVSSINFLIFFIASTIM